MRQAAEVYLAAFPETIRQLGLEGLRPEAVRELFSACYEADDQCMYVAEAGGRVVGYVVCPVDVGWVWRRMLSPARLARLVGGVVSGRYGIGLAAAARVIKDALAMQRSLEPAGADCRARIVSIAVHPDFQGRGIGRRLMAAALESLQRRGAECVRLEVRPDNVAARRLYESLGFQDVGLVHDTRGPWVVMILRLDKGGGQRAAGSQR